VVAKENAKKGDPGWVLTNPATAHEIEGYASATSVNRGDNISFFVSTTSPTYQVRIYRLGWYGGAGARNMQAGVTLPGIQQPVPSPDPVTGLVECRWKSSHSLAIPNNGDDPTDWASGVYLAKLSALPSDKESYIIFVVRDDNRSSQYLFDSSVTTYEAYNNWGGKSLYDFDSTGGRAAKVSFNRPYAVGLQASAASGVGAGEFLTDYVPAVVSPYPTGWEYNMLRFLERNGYDVTYSTDIDVHENPNLLLNHRAFLSVGHDEYWSWEMRTNVTNARDEGVSLGFFAANVSYWQIRLEPSPTTGVADRTQVCYKDTNDPVTGSQQTIQWRQLGMPEAEFVGVMYFTDRINGDIRVENTGDWVFAGAGLRDNDQLVGLLGYEIDQITTSSPANVIALASSPVQVASSVQYSNMSTYTTASGATVFATGSMQWSWGLDDYNAPALRPSRLSIPAQQITKNVLVRLALR
jgi:hypothetical protein